MNRKLSYFLIAVGLVLAIFIPVAAQLGIGTNNPDPSAALDIVSTTQGVLHPRLTTAQRNAISSPAEGLTIYNTTDKCLQVWDGAAWKCAVGTSDGGGGATLPTLINPSIPQVAAVSDNRRIYDSGLGVVNADYKRRVGGVTWLDNDTFALAGLKPLPNSTSSYDHMISIYNVNFGLIREFNVPGTSFNWGSSLGDTFAGYHLELLKNGNLVLGTDRWIGACPSPRVGPCLAFAIVDPQGNIVKPLTAWLTPGDQVGGNGQRITKISVLDNGNFAIHTGYAIAGNGTGFETRVFDQAGTLLTTVADGSIPGSLSAPFAWSPTSFGYISVIDHTYTSRDFNGALLSTIGNMFPATSAFNAAFPSGGPSMRMTRAQGNTIYLNASRGSSPPYGLVKFEAGTNAITVTKDIAITDLTKAANENLYVSDVAGMHASGKLLYIGMTQSASNNVGVTDFSVPVGVFADGTTYAAVNDGLFLMQYDGASSAPEVVKFLSLSATARINSYLDGFVRTLNKERIFRISPSGDRVVYIQRIGETWATQVSVLNLADLQNITEYPYVALNNNQPQTVGQRFTLLGPPTTIQSVEVQITDGFKSGDKLSSVCTPAAVGSIFIANTLALTGPSTMDDFTICLNEMLFKTTAAAGPRTITVKATNAAGLEGNLFSFTLNVGP
jgi:hypothetical protein